MNKNTSILGHGKHTVHMKANAEIIAVKVELRPNPYCRTEKSPDDESGYSVDGSDIAIDADIVGASSELEIVVIDKSDFSKAEKPDLTGFDVVQDPVELGLVEDPKKQEKKQEKKDHKPEDRGNTKPTPTEGESTSTASSLSSKPS